MDTTSIYRVESAAEGFGPYCNPSRIAFACGASYDKGHAYIDSGDHAHPSTSRDPWLRGLFDASIIGDYPPYVDVVGYEYRHGFDSLDTLLRWFHSCSIDALIAAGFQIVRHTVRAKHVAHGLYQSIYDPDAVVSSEVVASEEDILR